MNQAKLYKKTKNKQKFINFFKNEINEIKNVIEKKKKLNNPFIAFKYILYLPISIILATIIIIILMLSAFFIGLNNAKGTKINEH